MKKKIIAIGVVLIMMFSFAACAYKEFVEERTENMIELHTWFFTSGLLNNAIKVKNSDENAIFACSVDKGCFGAKNNAQAKKNLIIKSGETVYWSAFDLDTESKIMQAYVEIIVNVDDNIIGYAVIEINIIKENSLDYSANIIKSVLFPKIGGQYQNVSREHVKTMIEKIKMEKERK